MIQAEKHYKAIKKLLKLKVLRLQCYDVAVWEGNKDLHEDEFILMHHNAIGDTMSGEKFILYLCDKMVEPDE